jgi:hypothetical protein
VAGWEASADPYLAFAPQGVEPLGPALPSLAPGESVSVEVDLPPVPAARGVAWISLMIDGETLADHGLPPLQLSSEAP